MHTVPEDLEVCYCAAGDTDYCGTDCAEDEGLGTSHPTCECGHVDCEEATMREGGVVTTSR